VLEDHPDLLAPDLPELLGRHLGDVIAVEVDPPLGRFDQAVDHPQESRFAAPRKPDDHEDLTRNHVKVRIIDPDGRSSLPLDLGLVTSRAAHLQSLPGSTPEHHRTVLHPDDRLPTPTIRFRDPSSGSL
jgi:hypothetical protein